MAVKAMTLVGLDVHALRPMRRCSIADTGELRVSKLRMPPVEVASFLEGFGSALRAVYEAGPTGFGLAQGGARARDRRAGGGAGVDPEGIGRPGQDRPP